LSFGPFAYEKFWGYKTYLPFWKETARASNTVTVPSGNSWNTKITVPSGEKWLGYASLIMIPAIAGVYGTGSLRIGIGTISGGVYGLSFTKYIRDNAYESEPTVAGWFLLEEGDQLEFYGVNDTDADYSIRYGYFVFKL